MGFLESLVDVNHPELKFFCYFFGQKLISATLLSLINGCLLSITRELIPFRWLYYLVIVHSLRIASMHLLTATHKGLQLLFSSNSPGDCFRDRVWFVLSPAMCIVPAAAFYVSSVRTDASSYILCAARYLGSTATTAVILIFIPSQHFPPAMALCHYIGLTPIASSSSFLVEFVLNRYQRWVTWSKANLIPSFLCSDPPSDWYTYARLQPRTIRLLQMTRTGPDSIQCHLAYFSLDSGGLTYDAISYRWGSPAQTCSILVDGKHISIAQSVYDVLSAICPLEGTRSVWIDSICINQEDQVEKYHQLPLMGEIYRKARQVLAFLGIATSSTKASNFVHRLAIHTLEWVDISGQAGKAGSRHRPFRGDTAGWEALQELLDNEYWSRVWMIQEITLAKRVRLLYGDSTVSWWSVELVKSKLPWKEQVPGMTSSLGSGSPNVPLGSSRMFDTRMTWQLARGSNRVQGIPELIYRFRLFKSSNPQDKVYSLLGMCSKQDADLISQNFQRSMPELCFLVASIALSHGSFLLLSMAGLSHPERNNVLLPSWVPDLIQAPLFCNGDSYSRGYRSGGTMLPVYNILNGLILEIYGFKVGKIGAVSRDFPDFARSGQFPHTTLEEANLLNASLLYLMAAQELCTLYDTPADTIGAQRTSREEAFWRTLVADFDGVNYPARQDFERSFRSYISVAGQIVRLMETGNLWQILLTLRHSSIWPSGPPPWMDFYTRYVVAMTGRRFAMTEDGFMGLVPRGTEVGDYICVFVGSPVPFVLRPNAEGNHYRLWGDAYLHGFMNEESLVLRKEILSIL